MSAGRKPSIVFAYPEPSPSDRFESKSHGVSPQVFEQGLLAFLEAGFKEARDLLEEIVTAPENQKIKENLIAQYKSLEKLAYLKCKRGELNERELLDLIQASKHYAERVKRKLVDEESTKRFEVYLNKCADKKIFADEDIDFVKKAAKHLGAAPASLKSSKKSVPPLSPPLSPKSKSQQDQIHAIYADAIQNTAAQAQDTQSQLEAKAKLKKAFEAMRDQTQKDLKSGAQTFADAKDIADEIKTASAKVPSNSLGLKDLIKIHQRTQKLQKRPIWQMIMGGVLGAMLGLMLGTMAALLTGPLGAFIALAAGVHLAIIGATVGGAVLSSAGLTCGFFLTPRPKNPLLKTEEAFQKTCKAQSP